MTKSLWCKLFNHKWFNTGEMGPYRFYKCDRCKAEGVRLRQAPILVVTK